jgi:hypothetical protein
LERLLKYKIPIIIIIIIHYIMEKPANKCINIGEYIKKYRCSEKICCCDPNKNCVYSPVIKGGPCRNCYGTLRKSEEELIGILMNNIHT